MKNSPKIYIFSASDRFNFGDLLFNHLTYHFLSNECKHFYDIRFVSLIGNNLEDVQGHRTEPIVYMLNEVEDGDVIVLAGGGLLGHKWSPMLQQKDGFVQLKKLKKWMPRSVYEFIVRKFIFHTKIRYPYTLSLNDFNKRIKIIYNSVGGGALASATKKELLKVKEILNNVTYLSVRDNNLFEKLKGVEVDLAPDSAILLSKVMDKQEFKTKYGERIQDKLNSNYIIIHFNKSIASRYEKGLNDLIDNIKAEFGCSIYLVPVNNIEKSDYLGMKRFLNNRNCTVIQGELYLFEICALIANADFLIGTSLHTNIIACSFGVPHLGITKDVKKVNHFFNTWYPRDSIFKSYEIADLVEKMKIAKERIVEVDKVRDELQKRALQTFKKINHIISLE